MCGRGGILILRIRSMCTEKGPASFLNCPVSLILKFQSTGNASPTASPWLGGGRASTSFLKTTTPDGVSKGHRETLMFRRPWDWLPLESSGVAPCSQGILPTNLVLECGVQIATVGWDCHHSQNTQREDGSPGDRGGWVGRNSLRPLLL